MKIEEIARICHEANKTFCEINNDFSLKSWENTSEDIKKNAVNGVKYRINNPNSTPKDQHAAWSKDKIDNGWKLGPVKDSIRKEHPCLIPYEKLPEMQKAKDYLFVGVIDSLKGFLD